MKNMHRIRWTALAILIAALMFCTAGPVVASGEVTLMGEVNDSYQLVSDGQVYEIADTPKGNEMAENHINAKVKVTGTVEGQDDMKTITVTDFQVISE